MSDADSNDPPMPLVTHLTELRDRLLRALLAVLLVFICLFPFANDIYTIISEPLRALLPPGTSMIATEVASPFFAPFKLSLVAAIFIAMPYILYQVWSFIASGMCIGLQSRCNQYVAGKPSECDPRMQSQRDAEIRAELAMGLEIIPTGLMHQDNASAYLLEEYWARPGSMASAVVFWQRISRFVCCPSE